MYNSAGSDKTRGKGVWNMRHAEQQGVCHPVHAGLNSLYYYTIIYYTIIPVDFGIGQS
jgi:hypothetical protein